MLMWIRKYSIDYDYIRVDIITITLCNMYIYFYIYIHVDDIYYMMIMNNEDTVNMFILLEYTRIVHGLNALNVN